MSNWIDRLISKSKRKWAHDVVDYCMADDVIGVSKHYTASKGKYAQFYSHVFMEGIEHGSGRCIDFFLGQEIMFGIQNNRPLKLAIEMDNIYLTEQLLTKKAVLRRITSWTLFNFCVNDDAYLKFISCDAAQKCIDVEVVMFYIKYEYYNLINTIKVKIEPTERFNYSVLINEAIRNEFYRPGWILLDAVLNLDFHGKVDPEEFKWLAHTTAPSEWVEFYGTLLGSSKVDEDFINNLLVEFIEDEYYYYPRLYIIMRCAEGVDSIRGLKGPHLIDRMMMRPYSWRKPPQEQCVIPIALNYKFNPVYYQTVTIISGLDDIFYLWNIPREIMLLVIRYINQNLFDYFEMLKRGKN